MSVTPRSKEIGIRNPSKQELQRQIGRTRQSLSETVEEIKETAEKGYAAVKDTVSGVMDYREEFQKEPVVWSLGALSVGFALGYSVGYAHKSSKKGKPSQASKFANQAMEELSRLGRNMVMPALDMNITKLFGFDFPKLVHDAGDRRNTGRKPRSNRLRKPRTARRNRSPKAQKST